jgi:hypothetical protein
VSESWVYFIQAGGPTGPVKIGRSVRPVTRLAQLQTAQPQPLRGLGVLPERVVVERQMHVNWLPYRIRGEWFHANPNLIGYIRHHADPWPELTDVSWDEQTQTQLRYLAHWQGQTATECLRLIIAKAYGSALNTAQVATVLTEREPQDAPNRDPELVSLWLDTPMGRAVRCPRCHHRVVPDDPCDLPERCPKCRAQNIRAR